MTTGTGHVRTTCCFLNRNLTFRTLTCQKNKVNITQETFDVPISLRNQYCLTLGTFLIIIDPPFALLSSKHVITGLRGTFLNISGKRRIFFEQPLFQLTRVTLIQGIQSNTNIYWMLSVEGRYDLSASLMRYFSD